MNESARAVVASTELLERTTQLDDLADILEQVAFAGGQLIFLGGEAGVGKTALVHDFCTQVRATAQVLLGACDALSTPRPLGPLLDIAHDASGELAQLVTADAPRHLLFRATLDMLTASGPTLFVIEDAHWADKATLDFLRYLGRRVSTTRALVIVSYRDDEVGPAHPLRAVLGDLATSAAVRRIMLPPLTESAVRQLAAGSDLDPVELHHRTGGNPFFVTEVLAMGGAGTPPTVRDVVLSRAARLSALARTALEAAAVIGTRVEPGLLTAVMASGLDAVDECLAVGLLQISDGALGFRHELARTAILEAMSPVRSAVLHQSVLTALRMRSSHTHDLARLAHHAEAAADQEAVLTYAPAAARRAAAFGAHREAAAQFGRALRFAGGLPDDQREPLLAAWCHESQLTGQLADVIAAIDALIAIARRAGDRAKEAERQAWMAWVLVVAGRNDESEQISRASLDLLEPLPPGPSHAFVFFVQATLRMLNRDSPEAIAWGEQAIALAERFDNLEVRVRALNATGSARLVAGDEEGGRDDLEQSLDLARTASLDADIAAAFGNLGSSFGEVYRFARAEPYLMEGIVYAGERGLDCWHWYMVAMLALTRFYQGKWAEATELAGSVLRIPAVSTITRIMALVALGRVRARRGDPEVAATLDEALELATSTGMLQRLAPVHAARAEAAWLAGDWGQAKTEARAVFDQAVRHERGLHIGELSFWLWRAGEVIEPLPDAAEPFVRQIGGDWAGAAAAWSALGCPYEAARALADSNDEAALRSALVAFEQLGARPAALAIKRGLQGLGVRDIPRGPRPATRANRANLTPREAEVLDLVAAGSTNAEIATRLFVSPKTVEHHVTAILAKLGTRTRREAIRRARELGALTPN